MQRLEDERKVAGAALRKQITNVNSLFEQHQETDVMSLERECDILDLHRERMDEAQQMYFNEPRDSKELDQALQWFDTRDREYFQCQTRINEVLQCAEKQIRKAFCFSPKKHKGNVVSRVESGLPCKLTTFSFHKTEDNVNWVNTATQINDALEVTADFCREANDNKTPMANTKDVDNIQVYQGYHSSWHGSFWR